jgi:hypothetical protein
MNKLFQVVTRIFAVFAATALSVLGAGSLVGVDVYKAAAMAGIGGVATVIERLSRAYVEDGHLSASDINQAFAAVSTDSAIADAPKTK